MIRSNIRLLRLASSTINGLSLKTSVSSPACFRLAFTNRLFSQTSRCLMSAEKQRQPADSAKEPAMENEVERENIFEQFQNVNEKKLKKYMNEEKKHDGKLVYVGSLSSQLMATKFLSLSSSVLGLCLTPVLMQTMTEQSILSKLFVYTTCGFFIFVTPLAFQFLTRKYVNRLYYNYQTQTFTAILYNFFLLEYPIKFKLNQVHVPDVPGLFTSMIAKMSEKEKRKLFVDFNLIHDADLVAKIFGYDKPLDLDKYNK